VAVFFTSDTHFGHAGARALYRRPFGSVAEMGAAMVDRWNLTVGTDDEVWHLGDFALGMSATAMAELLARLHGRKHLITGNNDPTATTSLVRWSSVQPYAEIEVGGFGIVLYHYAFRTWCNMSRGWRNWLCCEVCVWAWLVAYGALSDGKPEQFSNELGRSPHIPFADLMSPPLFDHCHRLIARQRSPCGSETR
jgi:calcineurin-like phosphoesterase family protein